MTMKPATWITTAIAMAVALAALPGTPVGAQSGGTGAPEVVGESVATGPILPVEHIIAKVKAAGLTDISLIALEHGRYEIKCRDAKGRLVEVFIDRKTGELLRDPKTGKLKWDKVPIVGAPAPDIDMEDLVAQAKAAGMQKVYAIEFEHALYEIKAIDAQGRNVELFAHPKTGDLIRHPKTGKPMIEIID